MTTIRIGEQPLSIEQVYAVSQSHSPVELAEPARLRIERGRAHLESLLAGGERIYGVQVVRSTLEEAYLAAVEGQTG